MTKQKNKRLSQANRDRLVRFARDQVAATHDSGELNASYDAAADVVRRVCETAFPPRDMRVLAKYDLASPDQCVYVSPDGNGRYERFQYRDGDKRIPVRPNRNCRNQPHLLTGGDAKTYELYKRALDADKEARETRVKDFKALIYNSNTFNTLAEVWPAIEALREEIVGSAFAVSLMSDEAMARIKADPALVELTA